MNLSRKISPRTATAALAIAAGSYLLMWGRRPVGYFTDDAFGILAAKSLLQGRYVMLGLPGHPPLIDMLPGFPLLLAPFVAMFQPHWDLLKGVSIICTLGSSVLLWRLANVWLKPASAFAVLLLFAFNAETMRWSATVMSEPAYIFSILAAVCFLQDLLKHPAPWKDYVLGALLGFTALIRPQGIVWVLSAAAGILLLKRWRLALRALTVALALWLSAMLRNYVLTHTASGYLSLWASSPVISSWWLGHAVRVGEGIFASPFVNTPISPPALFQALTILLGVSIAGCSVMGAFALWRKHPTHRGVLRVVLIGCGLYTLTQLLWAAEEPRYYFPLLPFVSLFAVAGIENLPGRRRRGLAISLAVLLGLLYGVNASAAFEERRQIDNVLNQEVHAWIEAHTPGDSYFLCANSAELTLYTGRYAMGAILVKDGPQLDAWLRRYHVTHILIQPVHLLAMGPASYTTIFWENVERWVPRWPEKYKPVYQSPDQSVRIYEIQPTGTTKRL